MNNTKSKVKSTEKSQKISRDKQVNKSDNLKSNKTSSKHQAKENKNNKVEIDGVVVEDLQNTNYLVEIELQGLRHRLQAYPAGKMRIYYRGKILKGDKVKVEIDPMNDIDRGRIVYKYSTYKRTDNKFNKK